MAENQTTVALNLGAQRICMAVFETTKNGALILKGYATDSIIADPAIEASRETQVRVSLEDLIEKLNVPKNTVRFAISGQSVFTRFVKLPLLQDDDIEKLVTFEAQQHVPFPINEVVWDYEMIEGGDEKEVVIVAIKGDSLDEINNTVTTCGLSTLEVDVAPMALYNAFLASYGIPDEPTLILDIGAKSSNLLYVEGNRFFTRSVAIGGASITTAIAKEYSITFPEAEYQKVTNGIVALGDGHTESLDESLAALAMVIRNALTRLPAEIARTTNYYRSQHSGSAPKRVFLAGGGANLPYTLEFFQEKLGLPVEFFNPLSCIAIGKGVDTSVLQREAHTMGELIGLSLRGVGKSKINIDLVPSAVGVSRADKKRKPFLIVAAAVIIAGFIVNTVLMMIATGKAENESRTMTETNAELFPVAASIRKLLKIENELAVEAKSFTEVESNHAYWFDLMTDLRGSFASDSVWITEMTPLYGYDPVSPATPSAGTKVVLQPVVKPDFVSNSIKTSSVTDPIAEKSKGRTPEPLANAIQIKGYWRENPRSHNVVSDILKRLRENSQAFTFTPKVKGRDVPLSDEQIIKRLATSVELEGDLAYPFEITLPLARPVKVK